MRFFVCSTCDVIYKTEETIKMQIWHILSAYFTTLTNSKNFKNGIMGLYTTQAKYLHNKLRINFSMTHPLMMLCSVYYSKIFQFSIVAIITMMLLQQW